MHFAQPIAPADSFRLPLSLNVGLLETGKAFAMTYPLADPALDRDYDELTAFVECGVKLGSIEKRAVGL